MVDLLFELLVCIDYNFVVFVSYSNLSHCQQQPSRLVNKHLVSVVASILLFLQRKRTNRSTRRTYNFVRSGVGLLLELVGNQHSLQTVKRAAHVLRIFMLYADRPTNKCRTIYLFKWSYRYTY